MVNTLNSLLLGSMPRYQITSASINYYKNETRASFYPIKFLYTVNLTTLLLYQLRLKVNCLVILFYNINFSNSLCNGMCLIILSITFRLLRCLILRLQYYSVIMQFLYMLLYTLSSINSVKFTCYQFPIKLTFVIIINKT